MAGLVVIGVMLLVAVFAGVLAPYDPTRLFPGESYAPPSSAHWLGTDDVGRDVLSRLIHGARVSLAVGIFAQIIILAIGRRCASATTLARHAHSVLLRRGSSCTIYSRMPLDQLLFA
jgi:peptide/nickel transport system permease protein